TSQIAAVSNGRVVTVNWYQGTKPLLLDATTGAVLSEGGWHFHAVLSVTADGTTLFVGDGDSGAAVTRYSVATDTMVSTGESSHGDGYSSQGVIAALPDGSGVD